MKKNRAIQPPYLGECESARGQENAASYPARTFLVLPAPLIVILAKAGIHGPRHSFWIPTFVGMTD